MTRIKSIFFVLIFLVGAAGAHAEDDEALELGRTMTQLFFDEDIPAVWKQMTAEVQGAMGSANALQNFRGQVGAQLGSEVELVDEKVDTVQGHRVYTRRAKFEKLGRIINVVWSFDKTNKISGFYVRPETEAAASPYLDYETKADLRLPFNGEWYVYWGGRTVSENYHVASADQRFAYDMLIVRDGSSHRGDGKSKEQYYCWGESILAPGSGVVASVVSNLPDNSPGIMDAKNPPGNHVVIDLGNSEFMLLAHLQKGSVRVAVGDEVKAGDELGLCGNSGNTSEPHIHFHLQDEPGFGDGNGKPAFIKNYLSDGILVKQGEPTRGQSVQSAAQE